MNRLPNTANQNIKFFDEYRDIESVVLRCYGIFEDTFRYAKKFCNAGSNVSQKKNGNHTEYTVFDSKGKVALKLSYDFKNSSALIGTGYAGYNGYLTVNAKASIETSTIKVFWEQGKQVKMFEYAIGVEGALSETVYTPDGKRKFERLDSKESIAKSLKPLTGRDAILLEKKILKSAHLITAPPTATSKDYKIMDEMLRKERSLGF